MASAALSTRLLMRCSSVSAASRLLKLGGSRSGNITTTKKSSLVASRFVSLTSFNQRASGRLVPYKLADIGEGIREVTVVQWFVKPGDKVQQFDNICEVQSDKASVTITSRYDGTIKTLHYKIDETCQVGSALVDIELLETAEQPPPTPGDNGPTNSQSSTAPAAVVESSPAASTTTTATQQHDVYDKVLTTPAVRRIAKENNVDLKKVRATGRDGRVLKEDILAYLGQVPPSPAKPTASATPIVVAPSTPLSDKKYAKHMWKTMTQSLAIPHFVYSDECDVSKLVRLRAEVKEAFQKQGLSLSYMPFFLKAISRALVQFPELNALIDEKSESAQIKKEHNISLAMDTPGGLVVPNIKNVQDLSVVDVARELNRLQALGKNSSLAPNDLTGGTFSISNIGIVGGTYTKPVILSPQVVIGAIGKIQKLPRFDEQDNVIAANILSVSWAADHRVVDGVTMARFSNLWKHYIENPSHLILGL